MDEYNVIKWRSFRMYTVLATKDLKYEYFAGEHLKKQFAVAERRLVFDRELFLENRMHNART